MLVLAPAALAGGGGGPTVVESITPVPDTNLVACHHFNMG